MRRYLTAAVLAVLALGGCQQEQDAASGKSAAPPDCTLTVGWDPWEPYQYEAADGSVAGLDIEVAALIARDVGCEVEYVRGNWLDLLHRLRDGSVDMLLAATVIPERQQYARFSRPYRQESFALYVLSETLPQFSTLGLQAMLDAGKRIGYTEGYYYGAGVSALAVDERYTGQFVPAPVVELNYSRLIDGRIDALLDDPFVASSVIRRKGWNGQIAQLPNKIASGEVSLMFSRATVKDETVEAFNVALTSRAQDGTLDRLYTKYGS